MNDFPEFDAAQDNRNMAAATKPLTPEEEEALKNEKLLLLQLHPVVTITPLPMQHQKLDPSFMVYN